MQTVKQIAEEIVAREGGYVNDPADPGGATNHGVTIHTLRRLGLDLDRDGQVTAADVRRLTRAQAVEIYLRHYFERPRLAELPVALQASVFDMYVNAGSNAVKILQRLLTTLGWPLVDDGVIGPKTLAAARLAAEAMPNTLPDVYGVARRNYYYALGDARPASRKYCRRRDGGKGGWIVRAEAFIGPELHLTEAQHRARVASWG
ncbi:MAG: peptidoglycan-binding protein [Rhodobacterales bacterium 65-51]|uniref:holin-associated N-acetylmuramidase n=1 Tax=uncultured Gemmobacter sp. TaxID=1095917 RepID=UPI00095B7C47|nr:holin-associated N-acetylmuramidase [uncultured Gemmobacter sp.]OJY32064.1 MAG: peptidoglycan-binding protein [Rhodobacterales bacterium 65-51]